jgi:hypothetical protein
MNAVTGPSTGSLLEQVRALEMLGTRRLTGTPTEKAAQVQLGAALEQLGFDISMRPFRWTQSIYSSLMAHFGLATLASVVAFEWPLVGAMLHVGVALSYGLESLKRVHLIRALFPRIASQNLIALKPTRAPLRRRIVLIAHADAAFTGTLFHPSLVRLATRQPPPGLGWFKKQLGIATASVLGLAVFEGLEAFGVWALPSWALCALSIPSVLSFLLNLEVVLRNRVVPGAADNLSGCVACIEVARRVQSQLPDDVEFIVVISGAEEAGTGGAQRLAEAVAASGEWERDKTVVLGIDTLSNGDLRVLEEGELWPIRIPASLLRAVDEENAAHPELTAVTPYVVPSGATDALPFLVRGFQAMSLTCIDAAIGAPRHYHRPTDTWTNLDPIQLERSIDFAARLVVRLATKPTE